LSETNLKLRLHRLLPKDLHRQSMTFGSASYSGTPDMYYDGSRRDLWIEWKQLRHMPRNGIVIGAFTQLQLAWMNRRHLAGENVIGAIGLPNKLVCVQFKPIDWENGRPVSSAIQMKELASWVINFCGS
jgi:hypothetical protein